MKTVPWREIRAKRFTPEQIAKLDAERAEAAKRYRELFATEGKPFEMTVHLGAPSPAASCTAKPCHVCGCCSMCKDFHFYDGRGCNEADCPYGKR